jgi:hypothetical protein
MKILSYFPLFLDSKVRYRPDERRILNLTLASEPYILEGAGCQQKLRNVRPNVNKMTLALSIFVSLL